MRLSLIRAVRAKLVFGLNSRTYPQLRCNESPNVTPSLAPSPLTDAQTGKIYDSPIYRGNAGIAPRLQSTPFSQLDWQFSGNTRACRTCTRSHSHGAPDTGNHCAMQSGSGMPIPFGSHGKVIVGAPAETHEKQAGETCLRPGSPSRPYRPTPARWMRPLESPQKGDTRSCC